MFGSIYGIVSDAESGEPVRGASVVLSPTNFSTVTGSDGHYEFTDLEAGQYKIQVQAHGYNTNSRQISVVPGGRATGDIVINRIKEQSGVKLSTTQLNFDTKYDELSLDIQNTGNSGDIDWTITNIDVPWLSVSPERGTVEMGKSNSVKVMVDRTLVTSNETTLFNVNAAGGSQSVMVMVASEKKTPYVEVNPTSSLDFGTAETTLSVTLISHHATVNYEARLEGGNISWLTLNKDGGTIPNYESTSRSEVLTLTADRSELISTSGSCTLVVVTAEETFRWNVTIESDAPTYTPYIEVNPSATLDFGEDKSSLTVTLTSHHTSTGYTAYLDGGYTSWLSINKTQGTIPDYETTGRTEVLTLTTDRNRLYGSDCDATVVIEAGDEVFRLHATITDTSSSGGGENNGGGGNSGGNDGPVEGGDDIVEDYSSATVTSCDHRVDAEIVSCYRSGSSVVFTYTLTNNGLGNVNDWRIYTPNSMSLISGGTRSMIYDDTGKEYGYPTMTFRNATVAGSNMLTTTFPEDVPCKGTVTVTDVPAEAKKLTAIIGVYAYPNTTYNMADSKVTFKNVPIY